MAFVHEVSTKDAKGDPMCQIMSIYFPIAFLKRLRKEIDQLIEKYPDIQEEVKNVDETSS